MRSEIRSHAHEDRERGPPRHEGPLSLHKKPQITPQIFLPTLLIVAHPSIKQEGGVILHMHLGDVIVVEGVMKTTLLMIPMVEGEFINVDGRPLASSKRVIKISNSNLTMGRGM